MLFTEVALGQSRALQSVSRSLHRVTAMQQVNVLSGQTTSACFPLPPLCTYLSSPDLTSSLDKTDHSSVPQKKR